MCGIAGIIGTGRQPIEAADIDTITRAIAHRGPDGQQIWMSDDRNAAFGHRRLAIIDPTTASDQPMHSADGHETIVFNGEIYNFLEIRAALQAEGAVFRTNGDTEVILHAWRHWRWDMLPKFNGMWALAIRDNRSREVFFARDRFGVKPFVYAETDRGLVFASEARALLALSWMPRRIDPAILQRAVFDPFSHEASDTGLFANFHKLPAGHRATWRDGRLSVERWWHTLDHLVAAPATLDQAGERFHELFTDAIRLRMRSDVAVGTCLSGGFDSTAVTAAMSHEAKNNGAARQAQDWHHAFVASFPGLGHDETPQAIEAAQYAGIEPTIMNFAADDGREYLEEAMNALDDIYISLPTAIWKIYRGVRANDVKVTLDGHGADEAFGGYRGDGQRLKFYARNLLGASVSRGPLARAATDQIRRHWFARQEKFFLRMPAHRPVPRIDSPFLSDKVPGYWSTMDRRLYGMFHADILPTLLRNYDRLSMAHGVEIRMPFMDWRLVTFIMSLPAAMKADERYTKLAARVGMKGHMPESIRSSPRKVGFNSQVPTWMNGTLGTWAAQSLDNPHPAFAEIVDVPALQASVRRRTAQQSWDWSSSDRIWPYVNLNWYLHRHG